MKRKQLPIMIGLAVSTFMVVLAMSPVPAKAQGDCIDGQLLYSPHRLDIRYEASPVTGNRISWEAIGTDSTACYTVFKDSTLTEYDITVEGNYTVETDRDFVFVSKDRGIIGDRTVGRLELSWISTSPTQGEIAGVLNLSNSGGIYLLDLDSGVSGQSNTGIPSYLSRTNIWALDSWSDGTGASRIYAVIPGFPVVLSVDGGAHWTETLLSQDDPILDRLKNPNVTGVSITVDPNNPENIFVGTSDGLYRSVDGGGSFARVGEELSEGGIQEVVMVEYEPVTHRLFLCLNGLGFFESQDNGDSWIEFSTLRVPKASADSPDSAQTARPVVMDIAISPANPDLYLVALRLWGVYASPDAGLGWERRDVGMVYGPSGEFPTGRKVTVNSLEFDKDNSQRLLAASQGAGLFISEDLGLSWSDSTAQIPADEYGRLPNLKRLLQNENNHQEWLATTPSDGLLHSQDAGLTWTDWYEEAVQPPLTKEVGDVIWHPTEPDRLVMGTVGGGVYEPGTPIRLSDSIDPNATEDALRHLDIGLSVSFTVAADADSNGLVHVGDTFTIRGQTFQGYAVWRAESLIPGTQEPAWELVGLYDRMNPEFCYQSPCDEPNPVHIPGCFADKRANCFRIHDDGSFSFFDRDIYNGFTYHYAVSTFDYGFTGDIAPRALTRDMEFSPRSAYETATEAQDHIFPGNYNDRVFTVSEEVSGDLKQIWVVPNPLRRNAGWDTLGGASIHFINVTEHSRAEIFTLAGDKVADLTNEVVEGAERGTIVWDTCNQNGKEVASGVYIWRITNKAGEEVVGKLTIIR